ncbi:hypothetical protein ACFFK0_09005 [Paenibacillus chartarius]|uniref:Uncharacterized protein n=1 Tax=Paenibacillus chartarius TaxID=747481 RepID=A0ABV6DIX5_9BACL
MTWHMHAVDRGRPRSDMKKTKSGTGDTIQALSRQLQLLPHDSGAEPYAHTGACVTGAAMYGNETPI